MIQRRVVASEKPAVKSNGASKPIDEESKKKRERSEPEEDDGDGDGDEEEESEEEGDDSDEDGDEEDDLPLAKRQSKSKSTPNAKRRNVNGASTSAAAGTSTKRTRTKKSPDDGSKSPGAGGGVKWNTLKHAGVLFPPDYVPHGKKMLYDGKPVDLTPEQEEVASLFAALKEDDPYRQKPVFLKNFWEGFKAILGPNHVIKSFEKCDFKPMTDYFEADREAKKTSLTKEAKAEAKKAKDQAEEKYKVVHVDGRAEQNGNFRVEPPGLFRGRGEHPLMGKVKRRIFPRDIIINIGKGEPVPEHPYPGQSWMRVQHDQTVTWLAKWNDPVSSSRSSSLRPVIRTLTQTPNLTVTSPLTIHTFLVMVMMLTMIIPGARERSQVCDALSHFLFQGRQRQAKV